MNRIQMVVYGDSIAAGTSAKLDVFHNCFRHGTTVVNTVRETQTWRSIASRILTDWVGQEVSMAGAGVAGDTPTAGLARLEADVLSLVPDWVLVQFGTEEALAGGRVETFRDTLREIVAQISARGVRAVLTTPTPISERMTAHGITLTEVRRLQARLAERAHAVRRLAEELSIPLIDLHRYFLDTRLAYDHLDKGFLPDGVAQSAMASFVAGELLPMLGVRDFPKPVLCDYRNIHSDREHFDTQHNGFTDIAYFRGEFYVGFRAGIRHGMSETSCGDTLVLRSQDGITWVQDAVLHAEGFMETRDPKFLVVGDRLMLYAIVWRPGPSEIQPYDFGTYGFERLDLGSWSEGFECVAEHIFWRPRAYGAGYVAPVYDWRTEDGRTFSSEVKLLQSVDGRTWTPHSTILPCEVGGNETDLWVGRKSLVAFSRAEAASRFKMQISTYDASAHAWETVSSDRILHAPCVFEVGERVMVIGRYCSQSDRRFEELSDDWGVFTRSTDAETSGVDPARVEEYHHGLRTGIFMMDGTTPRLVMELLSAGDCSYTGAVQYGEEIVISDYSMHECYPAIRNVGDWETPCDIYVSRIRFGR
ncbi:MAG: GDSL-type esterase/lipase family protein [Candidatus Latescibacterota bacterium]